MKQILCCDWLPELSRWSYLDRLGLPVTCAPFISVKSMKQLSPIINPLLTKSRWRDNDLIFCLVPSAMSWSKNMQNKKNMTNIILLSRAHELFVQHQGLRLLTRPDILSMHRVQCTCVFSANV